MNAPFLLLASASPRRRDLLTEHGYTFRVQPADVEEIAPEHLTPAEIVLFNARLKAEAVAAQHPELLVLGVDTIVAFEGAVFGKPANMEAAFAMASRLNGKTHEVHSGVWLVRRATRECRALNEVTRVRFRRLTDAQLHAYLARIHPLDKAGAYSAQDEQGEFIECIEGSMTNVIGLPMEALRHALANFRE